MTIKLDPTEVNRGTWSAPAVIEEFVHLGGWTDPGEERALHSVAARLRGARLLDVGVGAGRTASMLALVTDNYVGIDFVPAMVMRCQRAYPSLDIRVGDARRLDFADGEFDVVVFSYNGLDAIDHEDRKQALTELARVLSPTGTLIFSTLNLDNRFVEEGPWQIGDPGRGLRISPRHFVGWMVRLPIRMPTYVRRWRNYFRNRRGSVSGAGWGLRPLAAHDFGLLVHYVTVSRLREETEAAGLYIEQIFGADGSEVPGAAVSSEVDYFHVVCRLMSYQDSAD